MEPEPIDPDPPPTEAARPPPRPISRRPVRGRCLSVRPRSRIHDFVVKTQYFHFFTGPFRPARKGAWTNGTFPIPLDGGDSPLHGGAVDAPALKEMQPRWRF